MGDFVYLYSDRNKNSGRKSYMVSSVEGSWCNIRKFSGWQLHQLSYRVRQSDCYRIPAPTLNSSLSRYMSDDEGDIDAHNHIELDDATNHIKLYANNHAELEDTNKIKWTPILLLLSPQQVYLNLL